MQKLPLVSLSPAIIPWQPAKSSNEQRLWKKYLFQEQERCSNSLTCLSSNQNINNLMAYGHGRTISLFDAQNHTVTKELASFTDTISAICLRSDANILSCADETGKIEIIETKEKLHLRTFRNHKKRVNALEYSMNQLYSGGDDFTLRQFDIAAGQAVHTYEEAHSDYIKCIKVVQGNNILSGSYDATVKLFDFRVHKMPQMVFQHGEQVEALDIFPSMFSFVAAGGKKVSTWDIRKSKPLTQISCHNKIVSGVKVLSKGNRFMTGSYDGFLKIFKADTHQLTYQEKLPAPILRLDVTRNNQTIGFALDGGCFATKSRKSVPKEAQEDSEKQMDDQLFEWMKSNERQKQSQNDSYFYRGIYEKPVTYDVKFQRGHNKKMSKYDKYLKNFQYKEALLQSLRKGSKTMYLALLDQYSQRGCFPRILTTFDSEQINQLAKYLLPLARDLRYAKDTLWLLQNLLKTRGQALQATTAIQLRQLIAQEEAGRQSILKIEGMLHFLMNSSQ